MITNKKLTITIIFTLIFSIKFFAQKNESQIDWHHHDNKASISTKEAYEELVGLESKKIVVAVIDSGVDINHEDLNEVLWVNKKEIPGNYFDDDGNGYKDDIHGWNFIGFMNGDNVESETLIETRIVRAGKNYPGSIDMYNKARVAYFKDKKAVKLQRDFYEKALKDLARLKLINQENKTKLNTELLKKSIISNSELTKTSNLILEEFEKGRSIESVESEWTEKLSKYQKQLDFYYNPDFESRQIVGDDFNNQTQKNYGNNDVIGPLADHGTHVSGIIAAKRDNNLGIDGIADNVEIMVLRVVPDGDERDKDVANAIIYAVDNGAKIINMSFGKKFSWNKSIVDKAVKYAEKKDVLIVHSAGNLSLELNGDNSFPNPVYKNKGFFGSKSPKNWIEVGATTNEINENLVASFSNYSSEFVDLFAPGFKIKSTVTNNKYDQYSGTSMAAPMVTGVAAVLRSYFPELKAPEIKKIIIESVTKVDIDVAKPNSTNKKELVPFSSLSKTGGILNFKNAVINAKSYSINNTK